MKIYFATGCNEQVNFIKDIMGKKVDLLISAFHWNKQKKKDFENILNVSLGKVIIDSGAFSIWKSGKEYTLDNYLEFIGRLNEIFKNRAIYVNLDVIPGKFGSKPTQQETVEACEQGYENYVKLKKTGLNIMPVYHQYDPEKWLDIYIKDNPYVLGVSPANDRTTKGRIPYLDATFRIVKDKVRCHGLAVTADLLMKRYPWYSVDSATWCSATGYGNIIKYENGKVKSVHSRNKKRLQINDISCMDITGISYYDRRKTSINALKQVEEMNTRIWNKRGVIWNE